MNLDNIQSIPQRTGMTISPDYDDATGEFLGFEAHENTPFADETKTYNEDEVIQEDEDHPDYVSYERRLADTFDEIHTTSYDINPSLAFEIASADIGNTRTDAAVQLFASQVYNGELTPEEAFEAAINTGLNPDELMRSYYKLQQHLNR